ncbi:MAG: hypothetical protein IJU76_15525 [Desulfovibrionaceae bacterium]|nr:hypothetical protein [Desulfovibrionaceae bacterium]
MSTQTAQESQKKDSEASGVENVQAQEGDAKETGAKESSNAKETKKKEKKKKEPKQKWYEGKNKEIVIYYLIAVFFLEIIVGTAAFFYGVAHAVVQYEGGPKLAAFPWVGWSISAALVPVVLLLLFHLSGWFFTRTLPDGQGGESGQRQASSAEIPKNVEVFYSVVSNAPVIVILLGLIALGGVLFFLDTALGTLRPYIPWILGSATVFLIICYLARLIFLARHHRMQEEYAYRMEIFRQTGVIITDKNSVPITAEQIAEATALPDSSLALPEGKKAESDDDIEDAIAVQENVDGGESLNNPTDAQGGGKDLTNKKKHRSSKKVGRNIKGRTV